MKAIKHIICGALLLAVSPLSALAQVEKNVGDTIVQESEEIVFEETMPQPRSLDDNDKKDIIESNKRFWKGSKKLISLGYTTGSFDLGGADGKLESRWGASFTAGRNIYVHRKPIANFLKFGIFIGAQISYMNFEKGRGSLSDLTGGWDDEYDEDYMEPTLGKHYLNAGVAVGPTATFLPFFASGNSQLARLKFRTYFHVVPSYSALILSDDEEADMNGAFTCLFSGGLQVLWRKLMIGVEWKGGRAKYKSLFGEYDGIWVGNVKSPRLGCRMFTASIGLCF